MKIICDLRTLQKTVGLGACTSLWGNQSWKHWSLSAFLNPHLHFHWPRSLNSPRSGRFGSKLHKASSDLDYFEPVGTWWLVKEKFKWVLSSLKHVQDCLKDLWSICKIDIWAASWKGDGEGTWLLCTSRWKTLLLLWLKERRWNMIGPSLTREQQETDPSKLFQFGVIAFSHPSHGFIADPSSDITIITPPIYILVLQVTISWHYLSMPPSPISH